MTRLAVAFFYFAEAPKERHQIHCKAFVNFVAIVYDTYIVMYFAIKPSAQNIKELGFACDCL
jgi:hypothetical protein